MVFEGGGASITDTTAYLMRGGPISAATRDAVMTKLFSPTGGIGLSFVRNPIGASDLSRPGHVSLDDTCCDLGDFNTNGYDTDVRLLTQQARTLNPALRVKGVPWSAPGWMKDNGRMDQMGWLKWEYYPMCAQYLVKYVQSYQAAGVPINHLSVQNEPNCYHRTPAPTRSGPSGSDKESGRPSWPARFGACGQDSIAGGCRWPGIMVVASGSPGRSGAVGSDAPG
nr:hypothetical protein Ade03nite_76250 [Actinoplanes derwentensis]